ncbi:hypothetical protein Hanom_Chr16g01450461 [Helianthus anomalus]
MQPNSHQKTERTDANRSNPNDGSFRPQNTCTLTKAKQRTPKTPNPGHTTTSPTLLTTPTRMKTQLTGRALGRPDL